MFGNYRERRGGTRQMDYQQIRQEVNIETLTQGLYLVNIRMNGMVKTEKLLVK